jgi:antitoxin component YwqK of YwqJK toxin-antitoxin module
MIQLTDSQRKAMIAGAIVIAVAVVIFLLNRWIRGQVDSLMDQPAFVPAARQDIVPAAPRVRANLPEGVYRKTRLDPGRAFEQNIIYIDGQEVARFKSSGDYIYDVKGAIPDGDAAFVNESRKSRGVERYWNGRREGLYQEYHADGPLWREILYRQGKAQTIKEYFFNGQLRMEVDYRDALFFSEDKESGEGKIYYRNGKLMYEWSLTNLKDQRYKKSYNVEGELTEVKLYDPGGKLVKVTDYRVR